MQKEKISGHGDGLERQLYSSAPMTSRIERIRRVALLERTDADIAYLETYDLTKANPKHHSDIYQAIFDAGLQ